MRKPSSRLGAVAVLALATHCVTTILAQTWDGESGNDKWTSRQNWNPKANPVNNGTANIIFGGTAGLTPNLNLDWDINSLTFKSGAGAFVLGGESTLTIRGGGIVNNDNSPQTIDHNITLGAAQTWNAASGRLVISDTVANAGYLLNLTGSQDTTFNGQLTGTGGLHKTGSGTILLGEDNRIGDSVPLTLGGGTFATGGHDDTLDALTLSANSTIDLSGGFSVLNFASTSSWTPGALLTINNWTGNFVSGGGHDQLRFGGITGDAVAGFRFVNPAGLPDGTYGARLVGLEVVPVPEPATYAVLLFLGAGLGWHERCRLAALVRNV